MYVINTPTIKMHFCPTYSLALEVLKNLQERFPEDKLSLSDIRPYWQRKWVFSNHGLKIGQVMSLSSYNYVSFTFPENENSLEHLGHYKVEFEIVNWPYFKEELNRATNPATIEKYKTFFKIHGHLDCICLPLSAIEFIEKYMKKFETSLDERYNNYISHSI